MASLTETPIAIDTNVLVHAQRQQEEQAMKITIDIDDELYEAAKAKAEAEGKLFAASVEDALRESLGKPPPFKLRWKPMRGELMPGVDIHDLDSLYDLMYSPDEDN